MTTINIYLTFNGTCEEAFLFYKSVFGGEIPYIGRYKDMPPIDGKTCAPEDGEKIMHIKGTIIKTMFIKLNSPLEVLSSKLKTLNEIINNSKV